MLPLSGAWTPKIVIDIMQRPMISDISASLSCPKPAPPSFGSRNAPHSPRAFTCSCRYAFTGAHSAGVRSRRIGSSGISSRVDEVAHPLELLLELRIGLEVPGHASGALPGERRHHARRPDRRDRREQVVVGDDPELAAADRLAARARRPVPVVSPVGPVKPSLDHQSHRSRASSVRCSTPSAVGRLRSDSITLVSTELGHSTLTPIGDLVDGELLDERLGDRDHGRLRRAVRADERRCRSAARRSTQC